MYGSRRKWPPTRNSAAQSPAERTSSTGRAALTSKAASPVEEVQEGEYFQVEEILDSRQGEKGWEYLMKWKG